MIDMYMQRGQPAIAAYHAKVTGIVLAWALMAAYLHWMLVRRRIDPALKYVAVGWDLLMITLLGIAAGGPKSPLICSISS